MLLTEFDKKKFARTMKKEGYEEGQRQIILHVLQSYSPEETASIIGLPLKQVLAVANISSEDK